MTFEDFINPKCDRLEFIRNFLAIKGIETSIIKVSEKSHILVRFSPKHYDPTFRMKTVIAHYDRVSNSEGANDNSFAVFELMHWAEKLSKMEICHNIRLIFTDGEEQGENGVTSQGAFSLAELLKKLSIADDVFVFDCMGRGDIPVLSTPSLPPKLKGTFLKKYNSLENHISDILSKTSEKWLALPTAYSDNAGFLACGIPAVTVTMLPSQEANNYLKLLMETKAKTMNEIMKASNKDLIMKYYPATWLLINSPRDTSDTLTEESRIIFEKILDHLAVLKILA